MSAKRIARKDQPKYSAICPVCARIFDELEFVHHMTQKHGWPIDASEEFFEKATGKKISYEKEIKKNIRSFDK